MFFILYCKVLPGSNLKVRSVWIEFVHVELIYTNRLAFYIFIRFLKHTVFHKLWVLNTFINVLAVILPSRYELECIRSNER